MAVLLAVAVVVGCGCCSELCTVIDGYGLWLSFWAVGYGCGLRWLWAVAVGCGSAPGCVPWLWAVPLLWVRTGAVAVVCYCGCGAWAVGHCCELWLKLWAVAVLLAVPVLVGCG